MSTKSRKKRKSGTGKKIRATLACLLAATLVGVPVTYEVRDWLASPVTAVAVFVCNKAQGVLVNTRDGKQKYLKPGDPGIAELMKKLPVEKRNMLSMGGPYCYSPSPQVH